jgi:peptidoglycan hydrolase CwlO-like protein
MDRLGQENKKSQDKSSDDAINAIYDVITGYNGIVANIIERTQPVKGKWSTRRSVDQSTVMYLAEVLKGLNEPLKHLEFQLNQVKDPDLATLQNMMNNLVKIIDQTPPFKMLDIGQYRFGVPNYEGLADDLDINSGVGYVKLLKEKERKLRHTLRTMKPQLRDAKGEVSGKIYDHAEKTLAAVKKEIEKAQHIVNAQLEDVYVNGPLYSEVDAALEALDSLLIPSKVKKGKVVTKAKESMLTQLINKKEETELAHPELFDGQGNFDATQLKPNTFKEQYLQILEDISKVQRKLGMTDEEIAAFKAKKSDAANAAIAKRQKEIEETNRLDEEDNAADRAAAAAPGAAPGEYEADSVPGTTAPGTPVGKAGTPGIDTPYDGPKIKGDGMYRGAGRPLADLLANPKQQYNYMQRPISDDQKIQNDMINANRNWQIKNNGPHDTPLGNLNPFLDQDESSKYSYEVLLAAENAVEHPETNGLGADVSLLQGPITNIEGSGKKSKALLKLKKVAIDERNDPYKKVELGTNGMIPEEKEDQFKLPEFKPKKRK